MKMFNLRESFRRMFSLISNQVTRQTMICLGLVLSGSVSAQFSYQWERYDQRVTSAQSVTALGHDLFGDSISLQTGALSFSVTDLDLPGNSSLPVRFTRNYRVINSRAALTNKPLSDWDIAVPRLTAFFASNGQTAPNSSQWLAGGVTNLLNRCSNQTAPNVPDGLGVAFSQTSFWQGIQLDIPGVANGELLINDPGISVPTDSNTWRWTTDGQVQIRCSSSILNGTGEGFVAVTPDGTEYHFNVMARRPVPGLFERRTVGGTTTSYLMHIAEHSLYASQVIDRFGNSVTYTYANSATERGKLTSITASDGRQITIGYGSAGLSNDKITSVSDGSRSWVYGYGTDSSPEGRSILASVLQPDGRSWLYNFANLSHSPIQYIYNSEELGRHCMVATTPSNELSTLSGSITHPSGAVGTFNLGLLNHGRSNVNIACVNVTSPFNDTLDDDARFVQDFYAWTLVNKTIAGPSIGNQSWSYSYNSDVSALGVGGSTFENPVCLAGAACFIPQCTNDACAGTARTEVIAPDNTRTLYTFGNSWKYNEGKLLKIEQKNSANQTLETITHRYDLSGVNTPTYPKRYGVSLRFDDSGFGAELHRPKIETITNRDGVDFKWTVNSCGGFPCLDYFARPTAVTLSSTLPSSKQESYTYFDQTSEWVLGQLATTHVTPNGGSPILVSQATYHPNTAQMQTYSAFGELQQTLSYHSDGNVNTITDGNNKTTTLTQWDRGLPERIDFADGNFRTAVIDNRGWVSSITDEESHRTSYGYDLMGRITSITYPIDPNNTWSNTSRSFAPIVASEYGIPAGNWKQTIETGNYRKHIWFDALWRPILEREWDNANATNTQAFIRRDWDHNGNEIFTSYPKSNIVTRSDLTLGNTKAFDAINRIDFQSSDTDGEFDSNGAALGDALTDYEYLTNFETRITNPRGKQTRISYQAFGQPSQDSPTIVRVAENAPFSEQSTTTFVRDVFGKVQSMTRSGNGANVVRSMLYDNEQRLCQLTEPESGALVMDYDAAGNLEWSAEGRVTQSTCTLARTNVPTSARITRAYDARNWLTSVDYPEIAGLPSPDQSNTYTKDGLLKTTVNANAAWAYQYNSRRAMKQEVLTHKSKNYVIGYTFNNLGHLSALNYPTGFVNGFNPNALGQASQSGNLVSGVSYHPNRMVAGWNYGNGIARSITQTTRQLPDRVRDLGTATVIDEDMAYDANANIGKITDGRDSAYTRTLNYDAQDRLNSAQGIWGSGSFTFDGADNLKTQTLGAKNYTYSYANQRLQSIGGSSSINFVYDVRGNQTSKNAQAFTWDNANRLAYASGKARYSYDSHGRRVLKEELLSFSNSKASTTFSLYNTSGQLLLEETGEVDANGVWNANKFTTYHYLGNTLVGRREGAPSTRSTVPTYLHTDLLGSVVAETSATQSVLKRTHYQPFGMPTVAPITQGPGYTGHVMDADTSLVYMQARYYDPDVGRFLTVDPVAASAESFNRYWYGNNNPYKFTDPDGQFAQFLWGAAFGAGVELFVQTAIQGKSFSEIDVSDVVVAAGAGALTGGVASASALAAAKGTISVSTAVIQTGAGSAAVGVTASLTGDVANGETPDVAGALIDGTASGLLGASGQRLALGPSAVLENMAKKGGLAATVAGTSRSANVGSDAAKVAAATSQAGSNVGEAIGVAAEATRAKLDEKK